MLLITPKFTFDDGPGKYTLSTLNLLKKYRIRAIFCPIGVNIRKDRKYLKLILKNKHELCNHTFSHRIFIKLSKTNQKWEIKKVIKLYKKFKIYTKWFRYPSGKETKWSRRWLKRHGFKILRWDISCDISNKSSSKIVKCFKRKYKKYRNPILLFHPNQKRTQKALPIILKFIFGK